jgi:hypothetical protein
MGEDRDQYEMQQAIRLSGQNTREPDAGFDNGAGHVRNWLGRSLGGHQQMDKHWAVLCVGAVLGDRPAEFDNGLCWHSNRNI